jgi:hypothetical protein
MKERNMSASKSKSEEKGKLKVSTGGKGEGGVRPNASRDHLGWSHARGHESVEK